MKKDIREDFERKLYKCLQKVALFSFWKVISLWIYKIWIFQTAYSFSWLPLMHMINIVDMKDIAYILIWWTQWIYWKKMTWGTSAALVDMSDKLITSGLVKSCQTKQTKPMKWLHSKFSIRNEIMLSALQ